jgi:pimeloyl-ACP methyl ester carboxylesterase
MRLLFCHGLDSSPAGLLPQALRAAGLSILVPDHRGMPLSARIDHTAELVATLGTEPLVLGGWSYGGAVAAWLAAHQPERFAGLLLCAPALHLGEAPLTSPPSLAPPVGTQPVICIHGERDHVVPSATTLDYAARRPHRTQVRLLRDGHLLVRSFDRISAAASELGVSRVG